MKHAPSQKRLQIGLYVHPWHESRRSILAGIEAFGRTHPNWSFYTPTPSAPNWPQLPSEGMAGVIIFVGTYMDPPSDFASNLPRVVIGNAAPGDYDLSWDNHAVGQKAAEYLIEQGHHNLASIHLDDRPYQDERIAGFKAYAEKHGVRCTSVVVQPGTLDEDLQNALSQFEAPTGLMLATDSLAHRTFAIARQLGLAVPEQLAVVGVGDDALFCELSDPPLSSVALPGEQLGFQAAALLDQLLAGKPRPDKPILISPGYVAVRRSSDMLAIDHPAVVKALRVIRQNISEDLTVNDVHAAVPLSRRALEIQFKKVVGRTIQQEIWRVRINHAMRLLTETDLPLDAIADRSGFRSAQRLSTVFARHTGEPPSAYRYRKQTPQP